MSFRSVPITSPPLTSPQFNQFTNNAANNTKNPITSPLLTPPQFNKVTNATNLNLSPSQSVCLSCLSPDYLSYHSLFLKEGVIITQFLSSCQNKTNDTRGETLHDRKGGEDCSQEAARISKVTTPLPDYILSSFNVDPPLELICIDNDTPPTTSCSQNTQNRKLPLLCVYNQRAAFVLDMGYTNCEENNNSVYDTTISDASDISGVVENIFEPFESQFLSNPTLSILRIRPAPNSYLYGGGTYETLCPRGSMLMLTNEGSLAIYHGGYNSDAISSSRSNGKSTTVPITIRMEDVEEADPIVDFAFIPSSPKGHNSLWNALSVLVSTRAGVLYMVSPIVFHGTLFPRIQVRNSIEYLEGIVEDQQRYAKDKESVEGSKWRVAKAAIQFVKDVYGSSIAKPSNGYYVMADVLNDEYTQSSAASWPVSLQGPVYKSDLEEKDQLGYHNGVTCVEILRPTLTEDNHGVIGSTAGVLLAFGSTSLHYVFVPTGDNILPRFAFESSHDSDNLNAILDDSSFLAERIAFDKNVKNTNDTEEGKSSEYDVIPFRSTSVPFSERDVSLILDPVDKAMVHHVSNHGVIAISSNVSEVMEQKLLLILDDSSIPMEKQAKHNIKTNAWSSIEVASGSSFRLNGVVVSGDVEIGHILVAFLSNGKSETVNITASQYICEWDKLISAESEQMSKISEVVEGGEALKSIEKVMPLHELISPLFQQISKGLSQMGKIVGGSTLPRDVTPGQLASFISMTQQCEQDVAFPLQKLNNIVSTRREFLQEMVQHQLLQIDQLRKILDALKARMKITNEKESVVKLNSEMLAERSANVLSAARALTPTLTKAELDYFKELKRNKVNCEKWEGVIQTLQTKLPQSGSLNIKLSEKDLKMCNSILNGSDSILKRNEPLVQKMEQDINKILTASDLGDK